MVEEVALVNVPVVEKKVGAVRIEVEALMKMELPETVKPPPIYTPPLAESTDNGNPGEVVPMPTKPLLAIYIKDEVALVMLRAGVEVLWAMEALIERTALGEEEAMPTLPEESILILSDELVAKIKGLAPVVEAVRVPLFQISGVWTEVEKTDWLPQRLVPVKFVEEALVMVPVVDQKVGRVA